MKNTLMFLLASSLLAFSLTACGGADGNYGAYGQTDGVTGDTGAYNGSGSYNGSDAYDGTGAYNGSGTYNGNGAYNNGSAGYSGSAANGNGAAGYNGSAAYGANGSDRGSVPYSSLVDDTRNVLDDAENAVNRTINGR